MLLNEKNNVQSRNSEASTLKEVPGEKDLRKLTDEQHTYINKINIIDDLMTN